LIVDGEVKSTCGICFNNCGVLVQIKSGRAVKIKGDPQSPVNKGTLCKMGLASLEYLNSPHRLKHPLKRIGENGSGKWQRISWDEALSVVADEMIEAKKDRELPETPYSNPELAEAYPLIFTSWKSNVYRHSGGRQIESLRHSRPEPMAYLHPQTARQLQISDGDWVYIETPRGRIKQKASLTTDIDPRIVGVDYAWWFPEKRASDLYGWADANINILTDDQPPFNHEMGSSNLRGILCKVYKQ
jgi:anaerobic selenocysteine-containing dehydrogenase